MWGSVTAGELGAVMFVVSAVRRRLLELALDLLSGGCTA